MTIRNANENDIESIVRIHCSAFKGFFLTSLGADFLKFYYLNFVRSKETVTLVAEDGNRVVGFSAAPTNCKGFNSRLIKSNLFGFYMLTLKLI